MIDEKKLIEEIRKRRDYWESKAAEYDEAGPKYEYLMDMCDGKATELTATLSIINEQPKVAEWIPCSERLPEEEDTCGVVVLAPSRKEDRRSHPLPVPAALRHPAPFVEVTFKGGMRGVGYYMNGCWHSPVTELAIDVIAWKEPSEPWEGGKE